MNAKLSLCASKLALALGVMFCAQTIQAQNLWEQGRNIAGEAAGSQPGHEAEAYIGGNFTSGEFRSPSAGKTVWTAVTEAEAVSSFKDLYLKGNFGFELQYGTSMMGSMFTDPGYYPVDVLEFTPGTKVRQTYDVGGGLAWKNGSRWTPGAEFAFRGVNYAKRKDLRHYTYRQEFSVAPSVHYDGGPFQLGLTAYFEKNSEFIVADQLGQARAEPYMAFLDKGMRYGTLQVWDSDGIHLNDAGVSRFPVKQYVFGGALQGSYKNCLYADVEYLRYAGEVGEKGYLWFHFPENDFCAKIIGVIRSGSFTHTIRADYNLHNVQSFEVVVDKVNSGGVTRPVIYGDNLIYRRWFYSLTPSYRLTHSSGWMVGAALTLESSRELGTLMYPYFDDDRARHMRWSVMGVVPLGKFVIRAGGLFIYKYGEHRHVVDTAEAHTGIVSNLTRLQDWWDREQEAADATRFAISASVRYTFWKGMYVEAGCNWMHAFNITLLSGNDRQTTHLKLGYSF